MNKIEFTTQTDRLIEQWPTAFGGEKLNLIFNKVKHLTADQYETVVDALILSKRFAPTGEDISQVASTVSRKAGLQREITPMEFKAGLYKQGIYCDQCGNNGFFLCKKSGEDGLPYAFSCHCDAHTRMGFAFPQFKQGHIKQGFYIDPTFTLTLQGELESLKNS